MVCQLILNWQNQIAKYAYKQSNQSSHLMEFRIDNQNLVNSHDLWGKYDIISVNGHQYYILFIDDATRYVTVHFLKMKDEAAQHVKNYIQALKTHGKSLKAIKIDHEKEFLNEILKTWLDTKGLDIQATVPYSPSQNGIAERMN